MVIHDFHVVGIAVRPAKTYTPLIVDADAELTVAFPSKLLQPVARWNAEILQRLSGFQKEQLPEHDSQQAGREPTNALTHEKSFGIPASKAPDHKG